MAMRTYKTILAYVGLLAFALTSTASVRASSPEAGTAASIVVSDVQLKRDDRTAKLESYLIWHGSPLAPYAAFFICEADRMNIDWRLVAAISGVESTFGKFIPADSYNGWGWGIFTGQKDGKHFSSWADGITQVSEGLRYNYINRGADSIDKIGSIYAASGTWASRVKYFMSDIDAWQPAEKTQDSLATVPLSL